MPPLLSIIIAALGAVPGLAALFGSAVWAGRTSSRLTSMERELEDLKDMKAQMATIAERTKNTDEAVKGQANDLRRITDHFLDESRSFARELVHRERAGRA